MIAADTTVARLLDEHPQLLEFLAGYHAHFEKLRDPLLRRVMAPRVTIAEAAGIAGVDPGDLLAALRRAAGEPAVPAPATAPAPAEAAAMPPVLAAIPESRRVHVDVRDDIRRGHEPFARIMAAVKDLDADAALVLRAPFEPVPLYDVLGKRGLAHWTERRAPDDFTVWFYRSAPTPIPGATAGRATPPVRTLTLDVRGLEPPLPMVLVLERLETLAPDEEMEVVHERRPMFLYPQLDERGFAHRTDEPEPGVVRIVIRRGAA
jgi:uncharacterized protein (DUF2249 family)